MHNLLMWNVVTIYVVWYILIYYFCVYVYF